MVGLKQPTQSRVHTSPIVISDGERDVGPPFQISRASPSPPKDRKRKAQPSGSSSSSKRKRLRRGQGSNSGDESDDDHRLAFKPPHRRDSGPSSASSSRLRLESPVPLIPQSSSIPKPSGDNVHSMHSSRRSRHRKHKHQSHSSVSPLKPSAASSTNVYGSAKGKDIPRKQLAVSKSAMRKEQGKINVFSPGMGDKGMVTRVAIGPDVIEISDDEAMAHAPSRSLTLRESPHSPSPRPVHIEISDDDDPSRPPPFRQSPRSPSLRPARVDSFGSMDTAPGSSQSQPTFIEISDNEEAASVSRKRSPIHRILGSHTRHVRLIRSDTASEENVQQSLRQSLPPPSGHLLHNHPGCMTTDITSNNQDTCPPPEPSNAHDTIIISSDDDNENSHGFQPLRRDKHLKMSGNSKIHSKPMNKHAPIVRPPISCTSPRRNPDCLDLEGDSISPARLRGDIENVSSSPISPVSVGVTTIHSGCIANVQLDESALRSSGTHHKQGLSHGPESPDTVAEHVQMLELHSSSRGKLVFPISDVQHSRRQSLSASTSTDSVINVKGALYAGPDGFFKSIHRNSSRQSFHKSTIVRSSHVVHASQVTTDKQIVASQAEVTSTHVTVVSEQESVSMSNASPVAGPCSRPIQKNPQVSSVSVIMDVIDLTISDNENDEVQNSCTQSSSSNSDLAVEDLLCTDVLEINTHNAKSIHGKSITRSNSSSFSKVKTQKSSLDNHLMSYLEMTKVKHLTWNRNNIYLANEFADVYKLASNIHHQLQDCISKMNSAEQYANRMQSMFEQIIAREEPSAPAIYIINDIDDELIPPLDYVYTNLMWHSSDAPTPDFTNLEGCKCQGVCNPYSETCSCMQHQENVTGTTGFIYDANGRLQMYENPIFECNALCQCGDMCQNRVVQKGRKVEINIIKTMNKGWGIFAGSKSIPAGTFIGIYSGEYVTAAEAEERDSAYLFDIDFWHLKGYNQEWKVKYSIDGHYAGNFTRYLNHSCDPNCFINACYINEANNDKPLITLFTRSYVKAGEELCFAYAGIPDEEDQDSDYEETDAAICHCGAKNCCGRLWA